MSFDYNYKFWVATKKDLQQLIKKQNVLKRIPPISDTLLSYQIFSELYVLYVELVNKLVYVYHHTFQVQKLKVVRELVEAASRRLQELKNQLKSIELSEYVYVDRSLIKKKLTPYDLVIWQSPQFLFRRPPEVQNILYDNKIFMDKEEQEEDQKKSWKKVSDAVIIIQSHERARQARIYKSFIQYDKKFLKVRMQKKVNYIFSHKSDQTMSIPVKRTLFNSNFVKTDEKCKNTLEEDNIDSEVDDLNYEEIESKRNKAALIIQKYWRLYREKRIVQYKQSFKQRLYGMKTKRRLFNQNQRKDSLIEMYKNEIFKKKLDDDFLRLITDERTRLLQQRTPWLMEDISDHIRAWFKEFYDKTGDFHPYPDEIKSGTILVLIDETFTPEEFREQLNNKNLSKEEKKKRAEKLKLQKQKEKEKKKKEKMKEAKRRKKMKDAGIIDLADELSRNKNIERMEKTIKQYSIDWQLVDEYLNKNHEAIKEWVTEGELAIIHKELRILVDQFMRIEYELLRKALCTDQKKKYKPTKPKKAKGKKGKKKKKEKISDDRSLQSLYDELKEEGIVEKYDFKNFMDFIAEFNFVADDLRDDDNLTLIGPAKGDIKMVIEDCMMGMGEFHVDKPKSICLIGPTNNGKKLLCNIIASELDAIFINLSPENTWKHISNFKYFIQMIMKVAKAFQPSIIFIKDCHRVFWKKVPPEQEYLNPRFLQKYLMKKILKPIKKDDKIMILGTSDIPWSANGKMKKVFQKIILVPNSDYGTSFLLWMEMLAKYTDDDCMDDYITSALAKVLQSYNSGDVSNNFEETLDVHRRQKLKSMPLMPNEFLNTFLDLPEPIFPPDIKILDKFEKWFNKSNKLSKERAKFKKKKEKKDKKK